MLSITLQQSAQQKLSSLYDMAVVSPALLKYKRTFTQPDLAFKQRGKIAASARLQKNVININPILFGQNPDYFLSHIIAHELAHILVYQLYGLKVKPHGLEWKKVMLEVFSLPPKVTHSLDVSDVAMREILYQCACQTVGLSLIRHNRVIQKKQVYICRKCKQTLEEVKS